MYASTIILKVVGNSIDYSSTATNSYTAFTFTALHRMQVVQHLEYLAISIYIKKNERQDDPAIRTQSFDQLKERKLYVGFHPNAESFG